MELTMTNSFGFFELNENEMMMVDGGSALDWGMAAAGVYGAAVGVIAVVGMTTAACAATCAAIAATPAVAVTAAICGVATAGYGIYCSIKS